MKSYIITYFLIHFSLIINYSQINLNNQNQRHSCPSCSGTGSISVTRKVHTGYSSSWYDSEVFTYKTTEKEYSMVNGFENCYRCGGNGWVNYIPVPKKPVTPKKKIKRKYSGAHYILTDYKKKNPNVDYKITTIETPLENFYILSHQVNKETKSELILSNGKTFKTLHDEYSFRSCLPLEKEDGTFFALKVITNQYTYFYNKNGIVMDKFTGAIKYISPTLLWIEDARVNNPLTHYKLISYPSKKQLISKSYPIVLNTSCEDLFNKHGLIDVTIRDTLTDDVLYGVINKKGEEIVPFSKNTIIGCDISSPYIYFIDDSTNTLLKYNYNGYLDYDIGKEKDMEHGIKGVIIKKAYPSKIRQINSMNLLSDYIEIETHTMLISKENPNINGFIGGGISKFDTEGWANFKKIKNGRQEDQFSFLYKNGFICSGGSSTIHELYNTKKLFTKFLRDTFQVKVNDNTFDSRFDLEIIKKGNKFGANYYGEGVPKGKKYEFKAKYLEIKELSGNILGLKNTKNKWQIQILFGKANGNHKTEFEFDSVLSSNYLYTFGKKNGAWHKVYIDKADKGKNKILIKKIDDITGEEKQKTKAVLSLLKTGVTNRFLIDQLVANNVIDVKKTKNFSTGTEVELKNGDYYFFSTDEKYKGHLVKLDKAYKDYRACYNNCIFVLNNKNKWNIILTDGTVLDPTIYSFEVFYYANKGARNIYPILENELGGFTIEIINNEVAIVSKWLNKN